MVFIIKIKQKHSQEGHLNNQPNKEHPNICSTGSQEGEIQ